MIAVRHCAALVGAFATIVISCGMKPIEADPADFASINKIMFLSTPDPTSFVVSTVESRNTVGLASAVFGFGAALLATPFSGTEFEAKIKSHLTGLELGTDLHSAIVERLQAQGYQVDTLSLNRRKSGELLKKYTDLKVPTDAFLDVSVDGGYTDRYTEDVAFCPLLTVDVRFVRKPSRVLYAQAFEYSCRKKSLSSIQVVPVDAQYQFADRTVLTENPELAREAVAAGVPLIADQIAAALKKAEK